jgi:hypothetical protein
LIENPTAGALARAVAFSAIQEFRDSRLGKPVFKF